MNQSVLNYQKVIGIYLSKENSKKLNNLKDLLDKTGCHAIIISSDKDFYQCLYDHGTEKIKTDLILVDLAFASKDDIAEEVEKLDIVMIPVSFEDINTLESITELNNELFVLINESFAPFHEVFKLL